MSQFDIISIALVVLVGVIITDLVQGHLETRKRRRGKQ